MCRVGFTKIRQILANVPYVRNGKFQVVVLYIEIALVNGNYYARKITSLTSKARLELRLNWNPQSGSPTIDDFGNFELVISRLFEVIMTSEISYLNENELIRDFWGHNGLKQPRIYKFKIPKIINCTWPALGISIQPRS